MSTKTKLDRRFTQRFALRSALLAMPALIALVLMWRGRSGSDSRWIPATFFLAWMVGWIILEAVVLRTYSCPTCGLRIKSPTVQSREAGDPIRYYCPRCDVEWETGLSEPSG